MSMWVQVPKSEKIICMGDLKWMMRTCGFGWHQRQSTHHYPRLTCRDLRSTECTLLVPYQMFEQRAEYKTQQQCETTRKKCKKRVVKAAEIRHCAFLKSTPSCKLCIDGQVNFSRCHFRVSYMKSNHEHHYQCTFPFPWEVSTENIAQCSARIFCYVTLMLYSC